MLLLIISIAISGCNAFEEPENKYNETEEINNEIKKEKNLSEEKNMENKNTNSIVLFLKGTYTWLFDVTILPIIISIIALVVSFWTLYKNRKTLTVEIRDKLECIEDKEVFIYNSDVEAVSYGKGLFVTIDIVNPSPSDIAFFELRAFDTKNNENIFLLTKKTLHYTNKDKHIYRSFGEKGEKIFRLDIPEEDHGVIRSNSFTQFDLFIIPKDNTTELIISFKVAIKSRFERDKFAISSVGKTYKTYKQKYPIGKWKDFPPRTF